MKVSVFNNSPKVITATEAMHYASYAIEQFTVEPTNDDTTLQDSHVEFINSSYTRKINVRVKTVGTNYKVFAESKEVTS